MNKNLLTEIRRFQELAGIDETVEGGLTFSELPDCVKENFRRNITLSVAFVKKDGTVRHMAFRRNLASYVRSDKPKSDVQLSMLETNNLMNVYDTNLYIKSLQETGDASEAARKSYRNFRLENVLAFLCKGKLFDMRDRNQILDRFGEEVYNQLTKKMEAALVADTETGDEIPAPPQDTEETPTITQEQSGEENDSLVGKKIKLVSMSNDPDPIKPGMTGTVVHVDDSGTIHVKWDNGRRLGVIPGVDKYEVLP